MTSDDEKRKVRRQESQARYRAKPESQDRLAAYNASPKKKAHQAKYRAQPKVTARMFTYNVENGPTYRARPEVKAHKTVYDTARKATPEGRAKALLNNSKLGAKKRGLEHSITLSDIVIPDVCPAYGIPLDCAAGPKAPNLPSLDRVDNTKGYVPGNVRVISWAANYHKGNRSVDQLLSLAEYVLKHQEGRK